MVFFITNEFLTGSKGIKKYFAIYEPPPITKKNATKSPIHQNTPAPALPVPTCREFHPVVA
jgi:hypothetical protein